MPSFEVLNQQYDNNELKVLLINLKEKTDKVTSFVIDKKYSSTVLLDYEGKVDRKYSILGIPTSFILDKKGKVVLNWTGSLDWSSSKMKSLLNELITEE